MMRWASWCIDKVIFFFRNIFHAMTKITLVTEQVVLYEDELADNGVSLLTVKVVNFPSSVRCQSSFCTTLRWLKTNNFLFFGDFSRESCQVVGFFSYDSGWVNFLSSLFSHEFILNKGEFITSYLIFNVHAPHSITKLTKGILCSSKSDDYIGKYIYTLVLLFGKKLTNPVGFKPLTSLITLYIFQVESVVRARGHIFTFSFCFLNYKIFV